MTAYNGESSNPSFAKLQGAALGKSLGVAGVIVTISDIAQPIAPVSTYVFIGSILVISVLVLFKMVVKRIGEWWLPTFYIFAMLLVVSGLLKFITHDDAEAKTFGVLGSNIEVFKSMQEDLGLIEGTLLDIETNTRIIAEGTIKANKTLVTLKKETSSNPRKELANLGVAWSSQSFADAIIGYDISTIELFLQGGAKDSFAKNDWSGPPWSDYFRTREASSEAEVYRTFKKYEGSLDADKWGLYHQAIYAGNIELIKLFFDYGENINAKYSGSIGAISEALRFNEITPRCLAKMMIVDQKFDDSRYKEVYKFFESKGAVESGTALGSVIKKVDGSFECN